MKSESKVQMAKKFLQTTGENLNSAQGKQENCICKRGKFILE